MATEFPFTRAVLYETEPEYEIRSVLDIIQVTGRDANAKRRLRRAVVNRHGDCYSVDCIIYEECESQDAEWKSYDFTKRFKKGS